MTPVWHRTVGHAVTLSCLAALSFSSTSLAASARTTEVRDTSANLFRDPGGSAVFSGRPPRVPFAMAIVSPARSAPEPANGAEQAGQSEQPDVVEPDGFAVDDSSAATPPSRPVTALPDAAADGASGRVARNACTRELAGDFLCYRCGAVLYQPVYYGGRLVYRILDE